MVAVQVDRKTERVAVLETKQVRATCERGLFHRQYNRVRINDMPSLWPMDELRRKAIWAANLWIKDLHLEGWDLVTAEADIRFLGPYQARVYSTSPNNLKVIGYAQHEEGPLPDAADFVLEADFIRRKNLFVQDKDGEIHTV